MMPTTIDANNRQTNTDKLFMILTPIGLCLYVDFVRDTILASPYVLSLDEVFSLFTFSVFRNLMTHLSL